MKKEEFTFFWSGPFSQCFRSNFTIDGISYSTAEKWMMAEKARLFKDEKALVLILSLDDPKAIKAIGRTVKNFDETLWNQKAKEIVKKGSKEKYQQSPRLMKMLKDTKGTTLVEASPYDKIWGIGLKETDQRALSRESWQGKNWLGEILTELRDEFLNL